MNTWGSELKGGGAGRKLGQYLESQRREARRQLYWFPMAAVANCHKLGGLKQYTFILLEFSRPESKISFTKPKSMFQEGQPSLQRF